MREIQEIYKKTATQLSIWSQGDNLQLRNVACAESLRSTQYNFGNVIEAGPAKIGDEIGFSILWMLGGRTAAICHSWGAGGVSP